MGAYVWIQEGKALVKLLYILATLLLSVIDCNAANIALKLISPIGAGTGTPAIPSTNRIFYAYPGIEYNIRAAVVGGLYPYTYALSNAPVGMTIKSRTGEITWTNPTSSASNIVLTVTDSESTQVQGTWSITVGTDHFWFVNSAYEGSSNGSITQPYKSLLELAQADKPSTDFAYFRTGTYDVFDDGQGYSGRLHLDVFSQTVPTTWLEYPGESVTIDLNDLIIICNYAYMDGLTFTDMLNYGFRQVYSPANYKTWRRCNFTDFVSDFNDNENQGMISTNRVGDNYYAVFQDNEFSYYTGGNAIGSLYTYPYALFENNYFHDGGISTPGSGFTEPISVKENCPNWTIRGNKIVLPSDAYENELYNNPYEGSGKPDNGEFLFNLVYRQANTLATDFYGIQTSYAYRNTHVGNVWYHDSNNESSDNDFYNNVTLGTVTGDGYTAYDNITVAYGTSGVIDTDGKLIGDYTGYVGTRGWQLSDGYTPMELGELDEEASTGTTGYGITMQGVTLQ